MAEFITVTGTGNASLPADTVEISLSLGGLEEDYTTALEESDRKTLRLKSELGEAGFEAKDIRTQRFDVQEEYRSHTVVEKLPDGQEEHSYKNVFAGYRWNHGLILEFARDKERLGRVLWLLAHSQTGAEFSLRFRVGDPRKIRKLAAADAVRNARDVAQALAEAAGMRIRLIRNVNYTFGTINIYSRTDTAMSPKMMAAAERSYQMDIEPEDVHQEEHVTVEFAVEIV